MSKTAKYPAPQPHVCAKCGDEFPTNIALEVHWKTCISSHGDAENTSKANSLAVVPSNDEQMGAQLTAQYKLAVEGMRAVVRFGAMLMQLREELGVESTRGLNSTTRGPGTKGMGLEAWLKQYAPAVPHATAYRYMAVAEAVQECCKLPNSIKNSPAKFAEFVQASPEALDEKLRPKQLSLWEEVDGSSQRSWMDRLKQRKFTGGDTSKARIGAPVPDPMDPAFAARDIWRPIGEQLEREGLVDKSWKDLNDADLQGLIAIVGDLWKELKGLRK